MKKALISGITGQDARSLPNSSCRKDMKCTVSCVALPLSTPAASNTSTSMSGYAT